MATQKANEQPKTVASGKQNQSRYTAEELAYSGKVGNPDVVIVAMRLAGKKEATLEEGKRIVDAFLKREVK